MPDNSATAEHRKIRWYTHFKVGDFAWLLFVVILLATAPEVNYDALFKSSNPASASSLPAVARWFPSPSS
jgi:hypothetical protein